MIKLHLFSYLGENGIHKIVAASRPYLERQASPLVAYLPAGSIGNTYQKMTEKAFHSLAKVVTMDTEMMTMPEMEALLRDASVLYIPGGNTYLLNHRLHLCKMIEPLRKKVAAGLPVVAFSAGTVLCGANILTSNDINLIPTSHFKSLQATTYNFNVHYPQDPIAQAVKDDWLSEYHTFQENPLLLMADGAFICVEGRKTTLKYGDAWILRKGQEKLKLVEGETL